MNSKACTKCGIVKLFSEFSKSQSGVRPYCKACSNAINKAYRRGNKEKVIEYNKAYRQANKQKTQAYKKTHKEELSKSFVAKVLKMSVKEIPHELYELKREQMLNARALRQFNEILKGMNNV